MTKILRLLRGVCAGLGLMLGVLASVEAKKTSAVWSYMSDVKLDATGRVIYQS